MVKLLCRRAALLLVLSCVLIGNVSAQPPPPGPPIPAPSPTPIPEPDHTPPIPDQEAKAAITLEDGSPVPSTWPAGFSIWLSSATSIAGNKPNRSVKWSIEPTWIDQFSHRSDGGRMINVGTGTKPKTLKITLKVAKADTFDETTITINVVPNPDEPVDPFPTPDPGPAPNPNPPPVPVPVPPGPAPLTGRAQEVYNMVIGAIDPMTPVQKTQALDFANNFMTVVGEISRGQAGDPNYAKMKDRTDLLDRVVTLNKSVIPNVPANKPAIQAWVPFFKSLETWLDALKAQGKLDDATGYADVFGDVAKGIKAASQ